MLKQPIRYEGRRDIKFKTFSPKVLSQKSITKCTLPKQGTNPQRQKLEIKGNRDHPWNKGISQDDGKGNSQGNSCLVALMSKQSGLKPGGKEIQQSFYPLPPPKKNNLIQFAYRGGFIVLRIWEEFVIICQKVNK